MTEKLDGTNAAIGIENTRTWLAPHNVPGAYFAPHNGDLTRVYAQSRKRIITPDGDNFGFAKWVYENSRQLAEVLGEGLHFGEWYGRGIQRGYGIGPEQGADGKFFALFNTSRWAEPKPPYAPLPALGSIPGLTTTPVLGSAPTFDTQYLGGVFELLRARGSSATGAVGYDRPEGIVVYHTQGNVMFKRTFDKDDAGKGREPVSDTR